LNQRRHVGEDFHAHCRGGMDGQPAHDVHAAGFVNNLSQAKDPNTNRTDYQAGMGPDAAVIHRDGAACAASTVTSL
jgi:hypothetical protein